MAKNTKILKQTNKEKEYELKEAVTNDKTLERRTSNEKSVKIKFKLTLKEQFK